MSRRKLTGFFEQVVNYLLVRANCLSVPVDLDRLSKYLGVATVQTQAMAAEAYVEQQEDRSYKIALRADRGSQRIRFSLAHELAHIILHRLNDGEESSLARQYRHYSSVSDGDNTEAQADLIAGAILVPSQIISESLPNHFSMKRIVELAKRADVSIPTAMIRAAWYATQPLIMFHLRRYRRRPDTVKLMWSVASRSLERLGVSEATRFLDMARIDELLTSSSAPFFAWDDVTAVAQRTEIYRRTYFERETIYGIAYFGAILDESALFVFQNNRAQALPPDTAAKHQDQSELILPRVD